MDGVLVRSFARLDSKVAMERLGQMLSSCLPLCLNAFLFIYVNNLSKYVIDGLLDERALTEYNAMFMLSFLISLLSGFTLRPALVELSQSYVRGSRQAFCTQLGRQLTWLAAFSVPSLLCSYWLGVRVLTLFYGINLLPYRNALCILMGGGALLAVYHVFQSALIIMRHQAACLVGISVVAVAGWLATPALVREYGMRGGAYAFFLTALLLAVVFVALTGWFIRKDFNLHCQLPLRRRHRRDHPQSVPEIDPSHGLRRRPVQRLAPSAGAQTVRLPASSAQTLHFDIEPDVRNILLNGLDDIAQTLAVEADITAFETRHNPQMP
jgi:O-antigen/teichoic acid export membrane protein